MSKTEQAENIIIEPIGKKITININLLQSEDEPIIASKTQDTCINEKNESVDLNKINKLKENNINSDINIEKEKEKKVKFLEPEFVQIIEVESYKKYNMENTCKDPFFPDDKKEEKTKFMCSCFIF